MTELQVGKLLLDLALLFALTYLLAGLLERVRIPGILGALFVAMVARYTPLGGHLLSPEFHVPLSFLAELGVLFLLFYIGLQIDLKEMRNQRGDIIWLTVLNTLVPFLMGVGVMLALGYGWLMAFVIGLTRMPTAEAVIVPILDEFKLIRTRVGEFIIGAGVLDDVIEVFLVALVSVWIGEKSGDVGGGIIGLIMGVMAFILLAWFSYRWLIVLLSRWLPRRPRNLMLLSMIILFGFGGLSEYTGLGMVVGAITAGVLMCPAFSSMGEVGKQVTQTIQSLSYGFLGLFFFFWVGLNADLEGLFREPTLAILLYLAGTVGKLAGVFLMVPMKKISVHEAWTIGIGLDARLTTEIIVAQLLFDAKLIDGHLFTALVSAASFTAVTVPLLFSLLIRRWGDELRVPQGEPQPKEHSHD
ncbi:cation:proton antiporter [Desulfosarcina sp.]|uniref:cation:proton antiporter n=1 Tax=Desulfosarcina sp. TaxID=2027861 RepID=UPI0029A8A0E4|nr:cation:proton antiporter [Desulfosarcina sp.]MDX2490321.1 cation:proton antiporter [Desulfosarcina sp.]